MNYTTSLNNFKKKIGSFVNGRSNVNANIAKVSITILTECPLMLESISMKKWEISSRSTIEYNGTSSSSKEDIHHHHERRPHRNHHDFSIDIRDFEGCLQPDKFVDRLYTTEWVFKVNEFLMIDVWDRCMKLVAIKLKKYTSILWEKFEAMT